MEVSVGQGSVGRLGRASTASDGAGVAFDAGGTLGVDGSIQPGVSALPAAAAIEPHREDGAEKGQQAQQRQQRTKASGGDVAGTAGRAAQGRSCQVFRRQAGFENAALLIRQDGTGGGGFGTRHHDADAAQRHDDGPAGRGVLIEGDTGGDAFRTQPATGDMRIPGVDKPADGDKSRTVR